MGHGCLNDGYSQGFIMEVDGRLMAKNPSKLDLFLGENL